MRHPVTIVIRDDGVETRRSVEMRSLVMHRKQEHIRWLASLKPVVIEGGKRVAYIDIRTVKHCVGLV